MKNIEKVKLISKAFNSSKNIDMFKVNLDLSKMSLDEATEVYVSTCSDIIECMKGFWCVPNSIFSWDNVFKHLYYFYKNRNLHLALPYEFHIDTSDDFQTFSMSSISPNGNNVVMKSTRSIDNIDDLMTMYKIDIKSEMFSTLLYEIAAEMAMMR